jgi:type II restriction/modification system DNA methylase subunit YeeA
VSLICFARREIAGDASLNGSPVEGIDANLTITKTFRLSDASQLQENAGFCFMGSSKKGSFEISGETARNWLTLPNPHGLPNADVVRPWRNGWDVTHRQRDMWIVDFGTTMTERDAALYEVPFRYVSAEVRPVREKNNREAYRKYWWRHAEPRPGMRAALNGLVRYIATPEVSKYRLFVWLPASVMPDQKLYAITRSDDVTFGVVSSRIHEVWALAQGSLHGVGNDPRYTVTTTFETFPFPQGFSPNVSERDHANNPCTQPIAAAAKRLSELREKWLNPSELQNSIPEVESRFPNRLIPISPEAAVLLAKRTLTSLYNEKPAWLVNAHEDLDRAVAAAYAWEWPLPDDEILKRLFELNQHRARPMDVRPSDQKREKKLKPQKKTKGSSE